MTAFTLPLTIRFVHCDPVGIVFYPRYFIMLHEVIECWYDEALGWPHERMLAANWSIPTVRTEVDFTAPSHLGDKVVRSLEVEEIRGAAVVLSLKVVGENDVLRARMRHTLVHASMEPFKSIRVTDDLRQKMQPFMVRTTDSGQ